MRRVTVGQWFGVLQKDGPGGETVIDHPDEESQVKFTNERRARKGLPPLPLPSERKRESGMKNEDVKAGATVITPHGPGVVQERDEKADGWLVRRDRDHLLAFYHAWDLRPVVKAKEVQTPAPPSA